MAAAPSTRPARATVPGRAAAPVGRQREAALLAVVLGVTAALVNTVPGWQSYAPAWTTTTTHGTPRGPKPPRSWSLTVDPVRLGNQILTVRRRAPTAPRSR